jgi:hypothetical protein
MNDLAAARFLMNFRDGTGDGIANFSAHPSMTNRKQLRPTRSVEKKLLTIEWE